MKRSEYEDSGVTENGKASEWYARSRDLELEVWMKCEQML